MTEAEIDTIIDTLQSAYTVALAAPGPNYTIGEISVSKNDYLKSLLDQIKSLEELKRTVCDEIVVEETYME